MPNLALYYRQTCGYCLKVLRFLQENTIDVPLKNINESSAVREELIALTGGTQVPCLSIDGKPMLESDDIIEWFKTNWSSNDNA